MPTYAPIGGPLDRDYVLGGKLRITIKPIPNMLLSDGLLHQLAEFPSHFCLAIEQINSPLQGFGFRFHD